MDELAARLRALEAERLRPQVRPAPGACLAGPTAQLQRASLVTQIEALERSHAVVWEARRAARAARQREREAAARQARVEQDQRRERGITAEGAG